MTNSHAADHVDGQALTGDYSSQNGQPQDGLDHPLDPPGQIGRPHGGYTHRDSNVENREAQAVAIKVNGGGSSACPAEDEDQNPAHRERPASRQPPGPGG